MKASDKRLTGIGPIRTGWQAFVAVSIEPTTRNTTKTANLHFTPSINRLPTVPVEMGPGTMLRLETALPGLWELRPKVFTDERGFFMETYHRERFRQLGISDLFVQDNHSRSARGTLRGLHYQLHHSQAKLCRVVEGEA